MLVIVAIIVNYGFIRLKRFVSKFINKLYKLVFFVYIEYLMHMSKDLIIGKKI